MDQVDLTSAGTAPSGTSESPTNGSEAPASDSPSSASPPAQPSADPKAFWSSLPREQRLALLDEDPDFKKSATKDVRTRDIQRQAAIEAQYLAQAQIAEAAQLRQALGQMLAERESERMARMTDDEKSVHLRGIENQALKSQLAERESRLAEMQGMYHQTAEEIARDKILEKKAPEWGLDDEDVAHLRTLNYDQFMVEVANRSTSKASKFRESQKALEEKVAALSRAVSGTSTYAATAGGASGGDLSRADLEERYANMSALDPDFDRIDALIRKRR